MGHYASEMDEHWPQEVVETKEDKIAKEEFLNKLEILINNIKVETGRLEELLEAYRNR